MLSNEPVRAAALIAGLLATIGGALIAVSQGVDVLAAVGTALAQLGLVVGGGEIGRANAWGPRTVDTIMDADAVIAAAERDGRA